MHQSKTTLKALLKELVAINAGAGHEQYIIGDILRHVEGYADELTVDPIGNVYATRKGNTKGPSLMVIAHMDEIGLIVKNILPSGFILREKVGGVPDNMLLGRKVYIGAKNIPGVIGTKPGHLQSAEEASRVRSAAQCYVDVGASSREQVEGLGIAIGDQIIWHSDYMELANPDLIATKAVDDRVGCAVLIELLRLLKDGNFGGTLHAVFSVREEMGLFGAPVAGQNLQPDYAVVLDTIPAGDTPDVDTARDLPIYLGKGPAFPMASGVGYTFASIVHPAVADIIEKHAAALKIHLQKMTLGSAAYATDADKLAYAGRGIPTATLAIPRRYSHSPVELLNINDALDVLDILHAAVRNNAGADLRFYKP